jgi:Domain of unknown function (DUF6134)
MARFRQALVGAIALIGATLVFGANARADDVEVREFVTRIDGNPVGQYRTTITRKDDDTITVIGEADVRMTKLGIPVFRYTYRGTEVWKDGRLVSLQSNTDDDGTHYRVTAAVERTGLRLKVNDTERIVRPDVWLTSYWQLPEARRRNGTLPLLDVDEGKTMTGALRHVGVEQLTLGGQTVNCSHYRITGPNMVDAWFDGQDRLVREEWVEKGRKVQIELTTVQR